MRFKEYAGQMIRYVLIVLENENRKPIDVLRAQYSFLKFDPDGKLDREFFKEETKLGAEMLPPVEKDRSTPNLIDAQSLFAGNCDAIIVNTSKSLFVLSLRRKWK